MTNRQRSKRGFTLTEILTATFLTLLGCIVLAEMMRFGRVQWSRGAADEDSRRALTLATARLAPDVRQALRIDAGNSNSTMLTVVLPKVGNDGGGYELPLREGDRVSFYLSDTGGHPPAVGASAANRTILWRAVNGRPDATWSLRRGRPIVELASGGLGFAFDGGSASSVTVSLTTRVPTRSYAKPAKVETRIALRNHRYF